MTSCWNKSAAKSANVPTDSYMLNNFDELPNDLLISLLSDMRLLYLFLDGLPADLVFRLPGQRHGRNMKARHSIREFIYIGGNFCETQALTIGEGLLQPLS